MKTLFFTLIILSLWACGEKENVSPTLKTGNNNVITTASDTAIAFNLYGSHQHASITCYVSLHDLKGNLIKSWSKQFDLPTGYTKDKPFVYILKTPGIPNGGIYNMKVFASNLSSSFGTDLQTGATILMGGGNYYKSDIELLFTNRGDYTDFGYTLTANMDDH